MLENCIRGAGFYRTKAARLRDIATYFSRIGGVEGLNELSTEQLRATLLSLRGIGHETADAIALYAYDRPVWVIDAYSRRLFERMAGRAWSRSEESAYVEPLLQAGDTRALKNLHALIVEHGKQRCSVAPKCGHCALQSDCQFGSAAHAK
jgi:endonuclease-3 related protein